MRGASPAHLAALVVAMLALPAAAQRGGCGLGLALEALRGAERALAAAAGIPSLPEGRAAADAVAGRLREAAARLAGCGCGRIVEEAAEAAGLVEQAGSEAGLARLQAGLGRARFSLGLVLERLGRGGCA